MTRINAENIFVVADRGDKEMKMKMTAARFLLVSMVPFLMTACVVDRPGDSVESETEACERDTHCKGDRVCVEGQCVNPDTGEDANNEANNGDPGANNGGEPENNGDPDANNGDPGANNGDPDANNDIPNHVVCVDGENGETDCHCTGDCEVTCENTEFGCDLECRSGTCLFDCPGGNCDMTCLPGSTCDLTCDGGFCDSICQADASCQLNCDGDHCNQQCTQSDRCVIDECDEDCQLSCGGSDECDLSCGLVQGCLEF